jgi:cell wall-associated NlpC family hydrolase
MKKTLISSVIVLSILVSLVIPFDKAAAASNDRIIQVGKQFMGVPYSYGGSTPGGFDCSGFVRYTYKKATGKTLPRSSSQMFTRGKSVSKSELQKGDLVFFRTSKSHNGVSHTGIYIGDNKFIHSSSSKGVSIASLNDSYWKPKFISGKRI